MSMKPAAITPCQNCAAPSIAWGKYCAACYGGVLHPDGLPIDPADSSDPWRVFNAEAAAYLLDRQMPKHVGGAIETNAYYREQRRWRAWCEKEAIRMTDEKRDPITAPPLDLASLPKGSFKRSMVFDIAAIKAAAERGRQAKKESVAVDSTPPQGLATPN